MNLKNPIERLNLVLWQPLAGYGISLSVLLALLLFRLGSLMPGFGPSEQASITMARSLEAIFKNPLFAPHAFLQYLSLKSGHFGYTAMRLPSVLMAVVCAGLFFYIVSKWFNFRVAVITSILFVTSSWYLQVARMATPEVTMLGLLAPLAYSIWLPNYRRPVLALVIGAVILVSMLYIPGFVWFAVVGIIWQRRSLLKVWRDARIPAALILCGCVIAVTPLIIQLAGSVELVKGYFGLPADVLASLRQLPKQLALIPLRLILVGPLNVETNLGRLPLLDFFAAVMATMGAYSYATHYKLRRSRLILASLLLGSILVALQGLVSIAILLPFIYLLIAGGINFMIEQWFMIFPYNPFARNLAIILISIAIAVTAFFHINRYFIAWPQNPSSKGIYHIKAERP
jgi:hypothetical protein